MVQSRPHIGDNLIRFRPDPAGDPGFFRSETPMGRVNLNREFPAEIHIQGRAMRELIAAPGRVGAEKGNPVKLVVLRSTSTLRCGC